MPPALKKLPMTLKCEWNDCEVKGKTTMSMFLLHIDEHVNTILPPGVNAENYKNYEIEPTTDELQCCWNSCGFTTTDGEVTLVRHLYFHAYHTKIKWWAQQEQTKHKFGTCILGSVTRNLIPDLPQRFVCYWGECQYFTDNGEHFYRHVDNHGVLENSVTQQHSKIFSCQWDGCETITKTKYKLAEHLRSHTQEKRLACSECGSLFCNRAKFIDHIVRQIAVDLQNYQCSHCSKIFASERLLRDHMRHHVNYYKCPDCDMTCSNPSMLKAHVLWKHTDVWPFKCSLCTHRCKSSNALRKHADTHIASNLILCDEPNCKYTAYCKQTMKKHIMRSHGGAKQPYNCHICNTFFSCGATLTRHLKKKHRFKWPSGHSRFRYKKQPDGFFRLQTVRYESLELTEKILKEKEQQQQPAQRPAQRTEQRPTQQTEQQQGSIISTDISTASTFNVRSLINPESNDVEMVSVESPDTEDDIVVIMTPDEDGTYSTISLDLRGHGVSSSSTHGTRLTSDSLVAGLPMATILSGQYHQVGRVILDGKDDVDTVVVLPEGVQIGPTVVDHGQDDHAQSHQIYIDHTRNVQDDNSHSDATCNDDTDSDPSYDDDEDGTRYADLEGSPIDDDSSPAGSDSLRVDGQSLDDQSSLIHPVCMYKSC